MGRGFLGFGRTLGEILPTSLPELPIQLGTSEQPEILKHLLFICQKETVFDMFGPGFRFPDLWSRL